MKTIRITLDQARYLLYNIPKGHKISMTVADADIILGKRKSSKEYRMEDATSGATQSINTQPPP